MRPSGPSIFENMVANLADETIAHLLRDESTSMDPMRRDYFQGYFA